MAKITTTLPGGSGGTSQLLVESFTYISGPQIFTLNEDYYKVYSVEVQGQGSLHFSQYNLIPLNQVEILDELDPSDYITITYGTPGVVGLVPYYSQSQTDILLNDKQDNISLTTIGNSGDSTFINNILNIPNYSTGSLSLDDISATSPILYNDTTGVISSQKSSSTLNGYLSSLDWNIFNDKQNSLNGSGFVKISGTTVSYDNSVFSEDIHSNISSLNLVSGTNTGDQSSIVGITGSKSQFDTSLTDGDFLYVGDVPSGTNLSYTPSSTNGIVNSDTGTDATIPIVDATNAGLMGSLDRQLLYNDSSTGVIAFNGLSINVDTTKFDVGEIKAWFVNNYTDPLNPTKQYKSFSATTANIVPDIATQNVSYLAIDVNGVLQFSSSPFDNSLQRDYCILGVIVHSNRVIINAVNNQPIVAIDNVAQLSDLMEAIGFFNISGNVFFPNGANLNINKSFGHIFKQGSNFINTNKDPHTLILPALTAPTNLRYRTQLGVETGNTSVISPNFWDNGGVLTAMTGTRWSVQRIYLFQSNLIRIQYGQATYASQADAIQSIATEPFVVEQNILENGLFRGLLIVRRNATNLSDTTRALFIEASKFGSVAGLGSLSTTSLQQAYNNSTVPLIITDAVLDGFSVRNGTGNADNITPVYKGQNTAGLNTFQVNADGTVTALSFVKTGGLGTEYLMANGTTTVGSGGITLIEIEKNIGSIPRKSGKFNITSTGLTIGKAISISQAVGPYTSKGTLSDETEMDMLIVTGKVTSSTNIICYWNSATFVKGNYKFNYAVSA